MKVYRDWEDGEPAANVRVARDCEGDDWLRGSGNDETWRHDDLRARNWRELVRAWGPMFTDEDPAPERDNLNVVKPDLQCPHHGTAQGCVEAEKAELEWAGRIAARQVLSDMDAGLAMDWEEYPEFAASDVERISGEAQTVLDNLAPHIDDWARAEKILLARGGDNDE
jgi:hypothetical protein